VEFC